MNRPLTPACTPDARGMLIILLLLLVSKDGAGGISPLIPVSCARWRTVIASAPSPSCLWISRREENLLEAINSGIGQKKKKSHLPSAGVTQTRVLPGRFLASLERCPQDFYSRRQSQYLLGPVHPYIEFPIFLDKPQGNGTQFPNNRSTKYPPEALI